MAPVAGYEILSAPDDVAPIDSTFVWRRNLIDYTRHGAYADLIRSTTPWQRITALASYARRFALLAAKRVVRYEMIPADYRAGQTVRDKLRFVATAARNATDIGRDRSRRGSRNGANTSNPTAAQLAAQGVAVLKMPLARRDELMAAAKPHFAELEARRGKGINHRSFDESRTTTKRHSSPELFALVEAIFAESGLSAAASEYLGRPARLVDINPQINDPTDSFWREIFDDQDGISLPQTAYFHRDASGGDLKVIIYCSDVNEQTGPFSYAVGSHLMHISRVDDLLCEANDHNGLSATDLEARRRFAALPAWLRQKGSFGNDLADDSAASHRIVDSTWRITGETGAIVAFDTKGIHRGGMVEEGERRVITCVIG